MKIPSIAIFLKIWGLTFVFLLFYANFVAGVVMEKPPSVSPILLITERRRIVIASTN